MVKSATTTKLEDKKGTDVADKDKWGYIVCFGTVITFIAGIGHVNSFGLIYKDFINETRSSAHSLAAAHGVFAVMLAIGGIILNIIIKKCSLRFGGLIGAAIFVMGSFLTIIISSTSELPLTFGVLQGIGVGMMVPVSYSTMNYYFKKKRTMVMSICKAFQGIVLMGYPQMIKKLITMYGFRGTLLIISGISLHSVTGMLVMKTEFITKRKKSKAANKADAKDDCEAVELKEINPIAIELIKETKRSFKDIILEILNVQVLKDAVYCNICLGQSFVNFSDLMFFILQPMLLFQYGFSTTEVAACISICAGADVAGRCLLAVISSLIDVNTRAVFYIATFLTFIMRLVILQLRQFLWVAAVTAVLGVLRAWLHLASPLTISNHVTHQDFPGAYALFMLATGVVNVLLAPLIGLLKDVYDDYSPAFYALTACCLPCLVLWAIEYLRRNANGIKT